MGTEESADSKANDNNLIQSLAETEIDRYMMEYIKKSIDKVVFSSNYFVQNSSALTDDFKSKIHLDLSYYYLMQKNSARKNDFELQTKYKQSYQKEIYSSVGSKSNDLVHNTKENYIKLILKAENEYPILKEDIEKKKKHILELKKQNQKLKNEFEELKKQYITF